MDFQTLALPNGLHVRPSMPPDKPFINQLYQSIRTDLDLINAEQDFIVALKESQLAAQQASYADMFPNAMYFIIEYHQERVGKVILDFGSNEILLVDISFVPKAQGKGLGSAVIRSFIYCAEQAKLPLKLSVSSDNFQAKNLYLKLGFVVDEIIPPREYLAYYPKTNHIRVGV